MNQPAPAAMNATAKILFLGAKIKLNFMIYQLLNFGIISLIIKNETTVILIPEICELALQENCKYGFFGFYLKYKLKLIQNEFNFYLYFYYFQAYGNTFAEKKSSELLTSGKEMI